ncbi:MAG: DUF4010 domain-containing protein [Woeseiaceae bacterium]|nr:DUF4010 domain-containing protein [Woeseiaceae bacterium]
MSRRNKHLALVRRPSSVLVASTVVYGRVLVELLVVAPGLVGRMLGPALAFSAVLLTLAVAVFLRQRDSSDAEPPPRQNPARMRQALTFAALYVTILFAVAAGRDWIGEDAVFGVAFVSGLTDVDALTLSVGQLFTNGETEAATAWRAIFLATLSNLLFKTVAAAVLGSAELRRWILGAGVIALTSGSLIVAFWP